VLWKLGPSGTSTLFHPLVNDGGDTCTNLWKPTWGATSTLSILGTTLRAALAQPTAEAAVNQSAMALLQGASKSIASFCATAKAAAASLPNA
jgi:ubiquitin-protein ligase